ncbi:MAG: phasin family protein [Neisseriaceae bacterium]
MFYKNNKQITAATINTLDATCNVFQTALDSIEKLTKTHLDSSKIISGDMSKIIKGISSTTSSKDIFDQVNQFATNVVESNIHRFNNSYEIFIDAQFRVGKVFAAHLQSSQQNITNTVDALSKFNPADVTVEYLTNFVNKINQATKLFNKASSLVFEDANNSVSDVADAAVKRTGTTVKK